MARGLSAPAGLAPIAMSVPRVAAVETVAAWAGLPKGGSDIGEAAATLSEAKSRLGPVSNAQVAFRDSGEIDGLAANLVFGRQMRRLPPPLHLNGLPPGFTPHSDVADSPEMRLLSVPGGYLCQFPDSPLVLAGSGDVALRDCSGSYAGLLHYYDADIRRILADALGVDGTVIGIADDVTPPNYRHFVADWLPRLAALGDLAGRPDTYVAVPPLDAAWQWELLRRCGFPRGQVIELKPWQSLRARHLLTCGDVNPVPHPGHKAAPWLLAWLRATLGYGVLLDGAERPRRPGKLYVRAGQMVGNEAELVAALRLAGYRDVDVGASPAGAQVALFAAATHIVAAHCEALTNVVFAQRGSRVIELFPATHGTPATYILAAGAGLRYASYLTPARPERRDIDIDIAAFLSRCAGLL